jgi:HAMP domain-containing protein
MNKNDANYRRFGLALVAVAALVLLSGVPARAAELTVADYVDLTIARLELAQRTWSEEKRSPVETEEAALFEARGTTAGDYFRFAGRHGQEIEGYLEENTDKRDRIEALSQEIERLIEQAEVTP